VRPPATLVYDGDCAFCSTSARFLVRWVHADAEVVPWQLTDLAPLGLTPEECDTAVQWVDGGVHRSGAAAFAAYLREGALPWRIAGRLVGSRAGLLLAEPAYRWVARNRHRLPGGTPACKMPDA
jgi:predicted DCC family thiol-disulfide oxidoreductase YuxK